MIAPHWVSERRQDVAPAGADCADDDCPFFMKPNEFTNPGRVAELASELTDGNRSPEVVEELGRLLATDPAALEWYCEWMTVHTLLHLELAVGQQTLTTSSFAKLRGAEGG